MFLEAQLSSDLKTSAFSGGIEWVFWIFGGAGAATAEIRGGRKDLGLGIGGLRPRGAHPRRWGERHCDGCMVAIWGYKIGRAHV